MSVREDLIAAKALIDTPEKWIKGQYADHDCLCALGAARMAFFGSLSGHNRRADGWSGDHNPVAMALDNALIDKWAAESVEHFNDHPDTTHADIMALFDRAIAAQGAQS